METLTGFIFLNFKITADGDCSHGIKRCLLLWGKAVIKLDSILKPETLLCQQRSIYSKLWFFQSHVWMWELDYKVSWVLKNWYFWTVVLEKILVNPLDCKEIQPVYPKGNQSWILTGRTDAEVETPIIWPPDTKNWLTRKTLMLGKIEGRKRRGQQKRDDWMASLTWWRWVWVSSGSWWTG